MSAGKEAELMTAALLYAVRCFAEGDLNALKEMNFGPKELGALREISMSDLFRVRALTAHCLQFRLNREIYWSMLDHLRHERDSDEFQRELIQADAPLEMMQSLFGITAHEYTRQRRMLTVNPMYGRTPDADEAQEVALWDAWKRLGTDEASPLTPSAYLSLYRETGISLRIIWNLVERWRTYGEIGNPAAAGTDESAAPSD